MQKDSYLFKGQRHKLVETIKQKGITDTKVLEAIGSIPRHLFFGNTGMLNFAYLDQAFPIGAGQTISQPYTVAFQTQLLEIKKRDKVLEIGTGSGYQAAVLVALGAKVYSIERQRELYNKTGPLLNELGYNAQLFYGDGFKGLPNYGPFDKIIITAAAPVIPDDLLDQLKIGGFMVIPLGEGDAQKMLRITKIAEEEITKEEFGDFAFVPMLRGTSDDK